MKAPRIALVTYPELPALSADDRLLLDELQRRGFDAAPIVWSDPTVPWEQVQMAILRSAWDAIHHYDAFVQWTRDVASRTCLWNPAPLVQWNSHKGYLLELAASGVPVVPTILLPKGSRQSLHELLSDQGWTNAVVKPAVSASAFATLLVQPHTIAAGQRHLEQFLPARDMLLQPYLPSVAEYGERALVFIDGAYSHTGRKVPALTPDEPTGRDTVTRERVEAAPDELALAAHVLSTIRQPTLYARVDIARDATGVPRLMELEVIDPALYLRLADRAVVRLAEAIIRQMQT